MSIPISGEMLDAIPGFKALKILALPFIALKYLFFGAIALIFLPIIILECIFKFGFSAFFDLHKKPNNTNAKMSEKSESVSKEKNGTNEIFKTLNISNTTNNTVTNDNDNSMPKNGTLNFKQYVSGAITQKVKEIFRQTDSPSPLKKA